MGIDQQIWCGYGCKILKLGMYANTEQYDDPESDVELDARPFHCTVRAAENAYTGTDDGLYLLYAPSTTDAPTDEARRLEMPNVGEANGYLHACAEALGLTIDDPAWWVGGKVF